MYAKINDHEYYYSDDTDTDSERRTDDEHEHEDGAATYAATSPYSLLPTDEDREAIIDNALDELADVARENILEFKREDFNAEEVVGTWIDSYLCQYFAEITPHSSNFSTATASEAEALNNVIDVYIAGLYDEITERFYEEIAPPRVSPALHNTVNATTISVLTDKIKTLREKPQPEQRTSEWYSRRNNLITGL